MPFKTLAEVRAANKAIDNHWFERGSMKFFNTRFESKLIGGKYFITSEAQSLDRVRKYSIRAANEDGSIETIGEFHSYITKQDAIEALKLHIKAVK